MQDLISLKLFLASDMLDGTIVTLTTTAANEVDVWNTSSPSSGDSPVLGGGSGTVT